MKGNGPITLKRNCDAVLIPSGDRQKLLSGSQVWITQSLGGSFTVMTDRGDMARIAGADGDALGMETEVISPAEVSGAEAGTADLEKAVWEELKTCFDPEIAINIVDLGLVYDCRVTPLKGQGKRVAIKFTLTASGCGMGETLKLDIQNKILRIPGIEEVEVQLVWEPPWDQSMISKSGKQQLGIV